MGILSFFQKASDGNFGFVARRCAYYYAALRDRDTDPRCEEDEFYYLTSACYLWPYRGKGVDDGDIIGAYMNAIRAANESSKPGGCSYANFTTDTSNPKLFHLILQIELLTFRIDNPRVSQDDIINAILQKQPVIEKNMMLELLEYKQGAKVKPGCDDVVLFILAKKKNLLSNVNPKYR